MTMDSFMTDLITWLRAQLDEDERKVSAMEREAQRVRTAPIFQGHPPDWLAGVDIFVSPTRWQAEIDAKRRILDEHRPVVPDDPKYGCPVCWVGAEDGGPERFPCLTVRLLALPYADREGYREEWRP